ncbi:hypothetical protein DFS33DRAFT_483409 [Desarmillaria ectypa]|nr:hypothetical protein DFS33DRAFT_483409 [Desarmillaria ectypa]
MSLSTSFTSSSIPRAAKMDQQEGNVPPPFAEDVEDEEKTRVGCLITEVVVRRFHRDDRKFLTMYGLMDLFKGLNVDEELMSRLAGSVTKA